MPSCLRCVTATGLAVLVTAGLAARQSSPHWSEATERVMLENGLTVLMLQRGELPIVSVQALYRAGSRNERPGLTGAAHFVEHMAFRSTDDIAKQDLTNQILRWGGRWSGYTSYDQTVYGSHVPSEYLEWVLYLERQRMRHVRFDAAEVERERTSVIAEERQYQNSPAYVLVEHRLRRTALLAHPYGSPIMGRMSDLEGVTAAELQQLYREFYAPNNLILAIVGRFDRDAALGLVRKYFGDSPGNGASTAIRTREPLQQGPRRVVMKALAAASLLELTVHAPEASSRDFATLLALDGILAGGKAPGRDSVRRGSRLHQALVEPDLATDVTTEVELSEYPGLYSIGVRAAANADLEAIERRLDTALRDTMETVTDADVARAVRQVHADLAYGATSNRTIANLLTVYEEMGTFSLLASIPQRLSTVTADDVRRLARERLGTDRRSIGLLVPEASATTESHDNPTSLSPPGPVASTSREPARKTSRPIPPPKLETPTLPAPVVRRLPNGLTVVAVQVPGTTSHLRIRIAAGSRFDPSGREGTAVIAARLLRIGRQSPLVALEDSDARVALNAFDMDEAFAPRNVIEFTALSLPGDVPTVASVIASAVAKRGIRREDLERARQSLADDVASRQDDSRWRAGRAVFDRLYTSSDEYGRPLEGTAESRSQITVDGIVEFYEKYYRPERTIVAIAGPGVPTVEIDRVAAAFSGWRPDAASAGGIDEDAPAGATRTHDDQRRSNNPVVHIPLDKAQASIAVALPGVARDHQDYAALTVLNYLLGETGYAGRLGEVLVDTGLAYAVYASVLADRAAGPIVITTDAVRARDAVAGIVATLEHFTKTGVSDVDLREAKGFVLGRLLFRFESASAATSALADLGYFGDGASLEVLARQVQALTASEVTAAARRFYDPSRAAIIVAGRH